MRKLTLALLMVLACAGAPAGEQLIKLCNAGMEVDVMKARQLVKEHPEAVKYADARGRTPLHAAAGNHNYELVNMLMSKGADLTAVDVDGNTPLHYAFSPVSTGAGAPGESKLTERVRGSRAKQRNDCIRVMLKKGAKPDVKNKAGKTPVSSTPDGDSIMKYYEEGVL